MTGRVLSTRELNRALLARQLLLERSSLPLPDALEQVADLQASPASWAGLPLSPLRPVLERVGTRRFRDEQGTELFDLPGAPLPDPATPAPPRFLSNWDANLLVHARRTQVLPERYRPRIFHVRAPHSFPTFLVDGAVAGTWRHEQGEVRLEPFEPLDPATRREVEDEAEHLALFHQG